MSFIKSEALSFFSQRNEIHELVQGLRSDFEISWANQLKSHRTTLLAFILKPRAELRAIFELEDEIAFFMCRYSDVEPRTLQAIDEICEQRPMSGRVDPTFVLLNIMNGEEERANRLLSRHQQSRIIIPVSDNVLSQSVENKWRFRNNLSQHLFVKDLFDYQLPVKSHEFFYGRENTISSILDSVRRGQNFGLFGLRRTGKTSVLLRVENLLQREGSYHVFKIFCNKRKYKNGRCDTIITDIVIEIDRITGKNYKKDIDNGEDPIDVIEKSVSSIKRRSKFVVIFDEIEYITPLSAQNNNWVSEFFDLWTSMKSLQTESQKIVFVLCGVNSGVCQVDRFQGAEGASSIPNPLLGLVSVSYLHGLSFQAMSEMIAFLGGRMGLKFSDDAIEYLFDRYQGHPLLTRLSCSFHHKALMHARAERPIVVSSHDLIAGQEEREAEISVYCEHVIHEIREFFPDQYFYLRSLALGDISVFVDINQGYSSIKALRDYGLVSYDENERPRVQIPVVQEHMRRFEEQEKGGKYWKNIVPFEDREQWVRRRVDDVTAGFELLNEKLREIGSLELFPGYSIKGVREFVKLKTASDLESLTSFLAISHKALVESIEKYYKKNGGKFHEKFCAEHPSLYSAMLRIKVYRHYFCHTELFEEWKRKFDEFRITDFGDNKIEQIEDGPFLVQQVCLDELHFALIQEISRPS